MCDVHVTHHCSMSQHVGLCSISGFVEALLIFGQALLVLRVDALRGGRLSSINISGRSLEILEAQLLANLLSE